jgi:membrane protein YqaA with SNARE-associated domain
MLEGVIKRFDFHVKLMTEKASALIKSRYGLWFLGLLSFVESSLLIPLITDPFMVAYIIVHKTRAVTAVLVTTFSSLFGGFVAYLTAAFFIDLILGYLSPETVLYFNDMVKNFQHETFTLAFLGAVTPIPFTLSALAAGTIQGSLLLFMAGALAGRALRYGIVGYLAYRFGDRAVSLARKNLGLISILTFIVVAVYIFLKM